MDIIDSNIVRTTDGRVLMSLSELSMTAQYNPVHSEHLTAESTYTIRNAIYQATGVAIDQAPITPHILFAKFTEAGLIQD